MIDKPRVIIIDLPPTVHGCTWHDEDGNNIICLNARDCMERQKKAYLHELLHIIRGDSNNRDYREYG